MKYLLFFCVLLSANSLFAYPRCPSDMASAVEALYRMPESRKLIERVEREGPIQIRWAPFQKSQSNAMWKGDERCIVLNTNKPWSEGNKIRSILFELHNASTDQDFLKIDQKAAAGRLSRWDYVEQVERLEHKNVLKTVSIIQKGINLRLFPQDTYWAMEPNFGRHFRIQQASGHSQVIAQMYDMLRHHEYFEGKAA